MVGGETLQVTLTTEMLGNFSHINPRIISIYVFHTIKAPSVHDYILLKMP